jgi:hypothetical protein
MKGLKQTAVVAMLLAGTQSVQIESKKEHQAKLENYILQQIEGQLNAEAESEAKVQAEASITSSLSSFEQSQEKS